MFVLAWVPPLEYAQMYYHLLNIYLFISIISIFVSLYFSLFLFLFFLFFFLHMSSPLFAAKGGGQVFGQLDFKLVVETSDLPPFTVVLLAPSRQEKAAWTSDISQVPEVLRKTRTSKQRQQLSWGQWEGLVLSKHKHGCSSPGAGLLTVWVYDKQAAAP